MTSDNNNDSVEVCAKIAEYLQCSQSLIEEFFLYEGRHLATLSKNALRERAAEQKQVVRFEADLKKLLRTYRSLPEETLRFLQVSGAPTIPQIEGFADCVSEHAQLLTDRHLSNYDRRGGKDWEAYTIALNIASIFVALGKDVTFWTTGSTPFSRAVEFALKSFGNKADWRRPAQSAADYAKTIQK